MYANVVQFLCLWFSCVITFAISLSVPQLFVKYSRASRALSLCLMLVVFLHSETHFETRLYLFNQLLCVNYKYVKTYLCYFQKVNIVSLTGCRIIWETSLWTCLRGCPYQNDWSVKTHLNSEGQHPHCGVPGPNKKEKACSVLLVFNALCFLAVDASYSCQQTLLLWQTVPSNCESE